MRKELAFQGLRIQPQKDHELEALVRFFPRLNQEWLKEALKKLSKSKHIALPRPLDSWFLSYHSKCICVLYLPYNGISTEEQLVKDSFNKAMKNDLIVSFRPLHWHEQPANYKSFQPTDEDRKLANWFTTIRQF